MATEPDTSEIRDWRSIITLIVFVLTNIVVLFPFKLPVPVPLQLRTACRRGLRAARILAHDAGADAIHPTRTFVLCGISWMIVGFPMDFVTAPLIADLFLLAILAIGRTEVYGGTVGSDNIHPIDIMVFFLSLAYIAISLDASGLIRYMAFKVLNAGAKHGRWLYFYLYVFFFVLASFIGNDPIILSGTAFLAYMTRVSSNVESPKAWIYMQFAVANIGSAILVSSNPANLVLAGAFSIKFIDYTANVIVPVVVTTIILFPFMLWVMFNDETLIPKQITMHELSDEARDQPPINPNIPDARADDRERQLGEILNPYLDKASAIVGAIIMAVTLVTILVINAAVPNGSAIPVFYVTLPAAVVMFCWDITCGWQNRKMTRELARKTRFIERAKRKEKDDYGAEIPSGTGNEKVNLPFQSRTESSPSDKGKAVQHGQDGRPLPTRLDQNDIAWTTGVDSASSGVECPTDLTDKQIDERLAKSGREKLKVDHERMSLELLIADWLWWFRETFPTVAAVLILLPWKLVPFALCMFVLVQALVTKGWVTVFAYGWDHWVNATGVIGAIGGMGFLAVVLCNFAGTNIGTTILLCRVVQEWVTIHTDNGIPITQRTFWATVYSMAIGVNYGAFSVAFSAALAGLLWRDILARKDITVRSLEFAWVNLPIIVVTMIVGCTVLIGEVYISRDTSTYVA